MRILKHKQPKIHALTEMMSVFQGHKQYDEESAEVISMARAAIAKATA